MPSDNKDNKLTSSSELESFELLEIAKDPVITQAYWKSFIYNHKYKIGGLATIPAIVVAAYKYNYLHLNYMVV